MMNQQLLSIFSGYGHIAPKTAVGKIVTIFYAIVGMPLTVLCWSNIGAAMANAFRSVRSGPPGDCQIKSNQIKYLFQDTV